MATAIAQDDSIDLGPPSGGIDLGPASPSLPKPKAPTFANSSAGGFDAHSDTQGIDLGPVSSPRQPASPPQTNAGTSPPASIDLGPVQPNSRPQTAPMQLPSDSDQQAAGIAAKSNADIAAQEQKIGRPLTYAEKVPIAEARRNVELNQPVKMGDSYQQTQQQVTADQAQDQGSVQNAMSAAANAGRDTGRALIKAGQYDPDTMLVNAIHRGIYGQPLINYNQLAEQAAPHEQDLPENRNAWSSTIGRGAFGVAKAASTFGVSAPLGFAESAAESAGSQNGPLKAAAAAGLDVISNLAGMKIIHGAEHLLPNEFPALVDAIKGKNVAAVTGSLLKLIGKEGVTAGAQYPLMFAHSIASQLVGTSPRDPNRSMIQQAHDEAMAGLPAAAGMSIGTHALGASGETPGAAAQPESTPTATQVPPGSIDLGPAAKPSVAEPATKQPQGDQEINDVAQRFASRAAAAQPSTPDQDAQQRKAMLDQHEDANAERQIINDTTARFESRQYSPAGSIDLGPIGKSEPSAAGQTGAIDLGPALPDTSKSVAANAAQTPQESESFQPSRAQLAEKKAGFDQQRMALQTRIENGGTVSRQQLTPFAGEPWADQHLSGRAVTKPVADDALSSRRAELQSNLRELVARDIGPDALAGQSGVNKQRIMSGDMSPGSAVPLDQAIEHASQLPEDHPARLVLHNLQELEKNPRGTKIQKVNTSDVADGTRVQVNDKETLTINRDNGTVEDGITGEIPPGGIDLYGKKILPPAGSEKFYEAPQSAATPGLYGQSVIPSSGVGEQQPMFHEPVNVEAPRGEQINASASATNPENTQQLFGPRNKGMVSLPDRDDLAAASGKIKEAVNNVKDFFSIEAVPKLSREGVGDLASSHALAPAAVPHIVRNKLAQVFPDEYQDPEAMRKTGRIIALDNVLGGYDQKKQQVEASRQRSQDMQQQAKDLAEQIKQLPLGTSAKDRGALVRQRNDAIREAQSANVQAGQIQRSVLAIQNTQDLAAMHKEVTAAQDNPKIVANIQRWKQYVDSEATQHYNELRGLDPDTEQPTRGRVFGARMNLLAIDPKTGAPLNPVPGMDSDSPPVAGNSLRNPAVKRDPFARTASLTGTYSEDPEMVLTNSIGRRWNEVTKLRFINGLEDKGLAVIPKQIEDGPSKGSYEPPPAEIGGKPVRSIDIETPRTLADGSVQMQRQRMYVRADLYREARDTLNTDLNSPEHPFARVLNATQLASAVDITAHTFNLERLAANTLGEKSAAMDILKKIPGIGDAKGIYDMAKSIHAVFSDTPQARADLDEMARKGYIRPDFPSTGFQKITHMQEAVHSIDTSVRMVMLQKWRNLVDRGLAPDDEKSEREWMNQVGQYNARLMGPIQRAFKQIGVSPFIVAGRNFNRMAVRYMTGSPGFSADSWGASIKARAMQLALPLAAVSTPLLLNKYSTGKALGRPGTPIGAWDTGKNDANGKPQIVDFLAHAGIRRGMDMFGITSLIEGIRQGKDVNTIAGNMLRDMAQSQIHPIVGPAPSFVAKTAGLQLDRRGDMQPNRIPRGGAAQLTENFRAAMQSQNPLAYAALRPLFQKAGIDQKPDQSSYLGGIGTAATSGAKSWLGIKSGQQPSNAAEDLARNLANGGMGDETTPAEDAKIQTKKPLLAALRNNPSSADQLLDQQVQAGKLTEREAGLLAKRAGMSDLQWNFRKLTPDDSLKVWNTANDQQKESLRQEFSDKIKRAQIGPDAQNKLYDSAGIERPYDLAFNQELSTLRGEQRTAKNAGRTFEGDDFSRLRQLEGFDRFIQQNNRLAKTGTIDQAEADRRNRQLVAQATKRAA